MEVAKNESRILEAFDLKETYVIKVAACMRDCKAPPSPLDLTSRFD